MRNRFDYETNDWSINNVCSSSALYGHDGTQWAKSGDGDDLQSYSHPQEQMDGSVTNLEINEIVCALGAADGNRQPTDAGIRIGNKKYMLTYKDDAAAVSQLTCMGGGAAVGKTTTAVVIGFWKKDGVDSNGKAQNKDDCFDITKEMCAYLIEQGY